MRRFNIEEMKRKKSYEIGLTDRPLYILFFYQGEMAHAQREVLFLSRWLLLADWLSMRCPHSIMIFGLRIFKQASNRTPLRASVFSS